MYKVAIGLCFLILSGCTHTSVSDMSFVEDYINQKELKKGALKTFPLDIDADMSCHTTSTGGGYRTSCSNKSRINTVVSVFKDHGLSPVPKKEQEEAPLIKVKVKKLNSFVEGTTGALNIITLGLSPLYSYKDYIVTYEDSVQDKSITKKVRVSSTQGWFSLFRRTPEKLKDKSFKYDLERNLISSVIEEAVSDKAPQL